LSILLVEANTQLPLKKKGDLPPCYKDKHPFHLLRQKMTHLRPISLLTKTKLGPKLKCMPAEIVQTQSNPRNGEISQLDVHRIITDFQNLVSIQTSGGRNIERVNQILIPIAVIKELIDYYTENQHKPAEYIGISFALTLPEQVSCLDFSTPIGNQLTVVIHGSTKDDKVVIDHLDTGDFVITAGFKSKIAGLAEYCCGNPSGGSGGSGGNG
jgi:hypothetical protein